MPIAEDKPTPEDEEIAEPSPEGEPVPEAESEDQESTPMLEDSEPELTLDEGEVRTDPMLPPPSDETISSSQEQTWAMLAHLSSLLNLITGILGPVVALIIYLVYKDRSRYIAYQSLQSIIFQLIVWVGVGLVIGAIWLITVALSFVLIGLLLVPFALLATIFLLAVPLGSLVYTVYAGIKCNRGEDFRYWLIGDWVRDTYEQA